MLAGKPCWPGVLCEFGFARRTTEACERAWLWVVALIVGLESMGLPGVVANVAPNAATAITTPTLKLGSVAA
jgi:hypothetical protein